MEANGLPEYFDAVLSVRFVTEDIVKMLIEDGIESPDLDDVFSVIDARLYRDYKNSPGDFSLFDDKGEEY